MVICIAGKNDIAVECLKYVKDRIGADKLLALPVKGDDGRNRWNSSLIFHAKEEGIKIVDLADLYEIEELAFFSLQYDRIIDPENFSVSKLFNIHFSLLPEYKGVYTTILPVLHGKEYSGVTLHKIDSGIDTGEIIDQEKVPIAKGTTSRNLYYRCMQEGVKLFKKNLSTILDDEESSKKQPYHRASYFGKDHLDLSDNSISCKRTAFQVQRMVNAYRFREYQLPTFEDRLISDVSILEHRSNQKAGTVIARTQKRFVVSTIDQDIALYIDYYWELMESIANGDTSAMKTYLPLINDVNETNSEGLTPLMVACQYENEKLVELLITNGADISINDTNGKTAINYALERGSNPAIIEMLQQADKATNKPEVVKVFRVSREKNHFQEKPKPLYISSHECSFSKS